MADSIFQLKWYCSTGVCPRGAQVRQRCGRSLNPLSSTKTIVRPSFLAFFLTPASAFASTARSFPHPAPGLARWDADSSSPTAAGCAKPVRHGSGLHIPPQSGGPPATPSTNRFRNPVLRARASARDRSSSGLRHSGEVCVQRAPLSSNRPASCLQLLGPATDRLPMCPDLSRHFGLMDSLFQQPRRPQTPLLQCLKVSPHSCRVSHGRTVAQDAWNVTILLNTQ